MTAALIMKEVDKKKLSLTDTLSEFYPEIPGSNRITIKQMMDMTSGLTLKGDIGPYKVLSDSEILDADIRNIKYTGLQHDKWNYAAINFNLLSGILEKVTGKSYHDLFEDSYIKKLHLQNTIFAYDNSSDILKATGYNNLNPLSAKLDYKNVFYTKKWFEYDELGTGQVYMTPADMYKVEKYIVAGPMLTQKSRDKMFVPGSISTYGGGLYHGKDDNFANGWGYGFQGVMHISDDGQTSVIALENYSRVAADLKPTAREIYQLVNN